MKHESKTIQGNGQTLPYCTTNGHEYLVDRAGGSAFINCFMYDNDSELISNPVSLADLKEMMETAKTFGIEKIELYTNYGVDIHSHTLKTNPIYKNLKIVKP